MRVILRARTGAAFGVCGVPCWALAHAPTVLAMGGIGTLGRSVAARPDDAGMHPRMLSRRPCHGRLVGDPLTGAGVDTARGGADAVLHLATAVRTEPLQRHRLFDAAVGAGVRHFVCISIVGVGSGPVRRELR